MNDAEPYAAKEARKAPGRPFKKGESANPGGKKPGTRNASTVLVEALLDGECEAITRKLIDMALQQVQEP